MRCGSSDVSSGSVQIKHMSCYQQVIIKPPNKFKYERSSLIIELNQLSDLHHHHHLV